MYPNHTEGSFLPTDFDLGCQRNTAVAFPFFTMQRPVVRVQSILNGQKLFGKNVASAFLMTSALIVSVETISSSFFDFRAFFLAGASSEEKGREALHLHRGGGLFDVLNELDIPQDFRQIIDDSKKEVSPDVYASLQAVLSQAETPEIRNMMKLVKEDLLTSSSSSSASEGGNMEESLTSFLLRDRGMAQQLQSATRVSELLDHITARNYSEADAAFIEEEIAKSSADVASGKLSLQEFEKRLLELVKLFAEKTPSSHSSEEASAQKIDTNSGGEASRSDTAAEVGENEE